MPATLQPIPAAWYAIANADEIDSPALLVYPPRIVENIRRMIAIAGSGNESAIGRLRPHVKTHKMSEVVRLQLAAGIRRFKCATLAEMEMTAAAGATAATDILLAHQPVGPKVAKLVALSARFPQTRLAAIIDDAAAAERLSAAFEQAGRRLDVLLDVDLGMGRTGIQPGPAAIALYRRLASLPGLRPCGLHAYDGHLHQSDPAQRRQACDAAMAPVEALRRELQGLGCDVSEFVAGGTPTFPMHALHADRQLSPGTCLLWDAGYAAMLPDLDFLLAAALLIPRDQQARRGLRLPRSGPQSGRRRSERPARHLARTARRGSDRPQRRTSDIAHEPRQRIGRRRRALRHPLAHLPNLRTARPRNRRDRRPSDNQLADRRAGQEVKTLNRGEQAGKFSSTRPSLYGCGGDSSRLL